MANTMAIIFSKISWCRLSVREAIFLLCSIFFSSFASAESILEMHQRLCAEGKETSCKRVTVMQEADEIAKRIEALGEKFAAIIDRETLESNNKPKLATAYPMVMQDYFIAEEKNGIKPVVPEAYLELCASHYHEYWVDKKLIWPTNDLGQPDWAAIYYFIVDHYYGYCFHSIMNGASSS